MIIIIYHIIIIMEDKDTELELWMKLEMMASNHTFKDGMLNCSTRRSCQAAGLIDGVLKQLQAHACTSLPQRQVS